MSRLQTPRPWSLVSSVPGILQSCLGFCPTDFLQILPVRFKRPESWTICRIVGIIVLRATDEQ